MIRTNIYKTYKSYKTYEETKGKLLKQQVFLSSYIKDNYDKIDKMLLFHGIGTGKTCTSITIAETIMEMNKKMKILVILPARLKTNYIDELISETCKGIDRYITKEEYEKFMDTSISSKEKDKIRLTFMERIEKNYKIISYENLRYNLLKSTDFKETIAKLTKDRVIIIDEVHNLIASKIKSDELLKILKSKTINKKTPAINAVILRLLTILADRTSKIFLLTATPVFDNFGQFIQLVLNLRPDADISKIYGTNKLNLDYLINLIKGKVSFYKLKDKSQFPKIKIDNLRIPLSQKQREMIEMINEEKEEINGDENEGDQFCMKERQLSISVYDKTKSELVFSDLKTYAPKLETLFKLLDKPGKHVIYSNFIQYCLELIGSYLISQGWSNYTKTGSKKDKTFVLWDASLKDKEKQEVKGILNSKMNMRGEIIKVILGSPSIKEGISFKHIQHLHQIDPVWNSSAKEQIEGRCVRYKSHEDIPEDDKELKKEVIIHNYIGTFKSKDLKTCDERIYDEIMVKKKIIINEIEKLLGKVAIDYYLWTKDDISPKTRSKSSLISVKSAEKTLLGLVKKGYVKKEKKIKNTCPKPRRPKNDKCINPKYQYLYMNKKGEKCCYAKKQNKKI